MVRLLGSASNTMIPQGLQTESYEFMVLENIRILNELVRLSVRSYMCMYAFYFIKHGAFLYKCKP